MSDKLAMVGMMIYKQAALGVGDIQWHLHFRFVGSSGFEHWSEENLNGGNLNWAYWIEIFEIKC
jgi:hypothetical protein